jgi:hypothetical protein
MLNDIWAREELRALISSFCSALQMALLLPRRAELSIHVSNRCKHCSSRQQKSVFVEANKET